VILSCAYSCDTTSVRLCFLASYVHAVFYYVAYPRQLFIFLSMPACPSNHWNHPTSLDSTNLLLFEFQALPMNPLILLASAQNLVTTGTRTLLAERIFEHEQANEHGPDHIDLHAPAPPMPPANSTVSQDVQRPSSGTNFSLSQLDQLRELIAEAVGPQWSSGLVSKHTAPFPRKPYQQCGIQRLTIEPATYSKYYTRWQLFAIPASAQSPPGSPVPSQSSCICCSPSRPYLATTTQETLFWDNQMWVHWFQWTFVG